MNSNRDNIIKSRRKLLGLTLQDVADHVGVSRQTVQKWESGKIKNMGIDKIAKVTEILELSPFDIMYMENGTVQERLNLAFNTQQANLRDISDKTGITESKLKTYMNDNISVPETHLKALAKALDISERYLKGVSLQMKSNDDQILELPDNYKEFILELYDLILKRPDIMSVIKMGITLNEEEIDTVTILIKGLVKKRKTN